MYEEYKYQGHTLSEWAKTLNHTFSLGELYQMAKSDRDFTKLLEHRKEYDLDLSK